MTMQRLVLAVVMAMQLMHFSPLGVEGCARSHDSHSGRQDALLAALVALHAGADCSSPRPQGELQLAVIQEAVRVVNTYGGIPIGLRVFDTCSSPDGAVKATLKALIAAEEDTCLQPPFFLGFVGPDDPESVEEVSRVVHVFNLTHVVPWRLSRTPWLKDHTLHVANTRHDRTAQAVLTMMRKAGWTSFLAAHTGSSDASRKTKVLLQMAAGSDVCSVSEAAQLPADDVINKLQQGGATPSGAVLMVDWWQPAVQFLSRLPASLADMQVLVVSADAELPPRLPSASNVTALLLLETTAVQLAQAFRQRLPSNKVGNITDNGKKLHLASNWSLHAPPSTATCTNNVEKVAVNIYNTGTLWPDMVGGHGFYEAVGMMAGAGTALVGILILCTWVVYRSFRVPGKRRSPPSSVSSFTHMS